MFPRFAFVGYFAASIVGAGPACARADSRTTDDIAGDVPTADTVAHRTPTTSMDTVGRS